MPIHYNQKHVSFCRSIKHRGTFNTVMGYFYLSRREVPNAVSKTDLAQLVVVGLHKRKSGGPDHFMAETQQKLSFFLTSRRAPKKSKDEKLGKQTRKRD
jgi:hypothetical protein